MRYIILSKNKTYVYSLNKEQFNKFIDFLKIENRENYKVIEEYNNIKVCQFKTNATFLKHYCWNTIGTFY